VNDPAHRADDLAAHADVLAGRLSVLTSQLAEERTWRRRLFRSLLAAAVIVVFLLGALVWVGGQLLKIAEVNRVNGRILIECTTPSPPTGRASSPEDRVHECYEDGQARTGGAIHAINEANRHAVAAAFQCVIEKRADLDACIDEKVGEGQP
jgi:hypothetical protein